MKPSDTLLSAVAHVESGGGGLYTAQMYDRESESGTDFICAVMPPPRKNGMFAFSPYKLPQSHRATILAMAYALAKDAGK